MSSRKLEEGQPLAATAHVLRLPRPPRDFDADNSVADWHWFEPSTGDKAHAEERGKPVRVSVWDSERTTVEEARAFRSAITIVLRLGVQDVLDVAEASGHPMIVVYDPLDPPDDTRAGADGHAGIEGLLRAPGQPKTAWRNRLEALATRARLIAGPA